MKWLKLPVIIFGMVSVWTFYSSAQNNPIGLYEGLMGNSGVASFESSAPSFYNPALLSLRKTKSIVLGGNTISTISSKTNSAEASGSSFNPTYISSIDVFDSYAHELFIINLIDANLVSESTTANNKLQFNTRTQNFAAGYSFAFPNFPMGFQVLLYQQSNSGIALFDGTTGTERTVGNIKIDRRIFYTGFGISTILNFTNYNLGFNYRSRQMQVTDSDQSKYKAYLYDSAGGTLSEIQGNSKTELGRPFGNTLLVGQGFKIGAHEFLTDSSFVESEDLNQSYSWRQSYGYRLGLSESHQFLVGLNHLINDKVRYFGQDAYCSVGYSWKTRTYRTSVGLFLWNEKLTQSSQIYGLTFNSEFSY